MSTLPDGGAYVTWWRLHTAGARWACRPESFPLAGNSRVDQVKRYVRAGVGEEPRALADHHGIREQGDLVDQVVGEQPADQAATAVHLQLTRRLGFQLADGRREVTGEDGRVRPARFGECGRCDVLGLRVQSRPDRAVARIVPRSPGAGEDHDSPLTEQEATSTLADLDGICHGLIPDPVARL